MFMSLLHYVENLLTYQKQNIMKLTILNIISAK